MIPDDDKINFLEEEGSSDSSGLSWLVLVVDDEKVVHDVTNLFLKGLVIHARKFETLNAYTGKDAIEILKSREDIDLVFLDCIMESEDAGFEVARYVKNVLGRTIPIIVMKSGEVGMDPEDILVAHPEIDEFVQKSYVTISHIRSILMKWLPVQG